MVRGVASLIVVSTAWALYLGCASTGSGGPGTGGAGGVAGTGGTLRDAGGDAACADPAEKRCGSACVGVNDPFYGCGPNTCEPCALANAGMETCENDQCALVNCLGDFQDCDCQPSNGCETQATFCSAAAGAFDPGPAQDVRVDAVSVYWSTSDGIRKKDKAGGQAVTVVSGQDAPARFAIDATTVFFTTHVAGTVMKADFASGSAVPLASGQDSPIWIALDATRVYWINAGSTSTPGSVMAIDKTGGSPTVLASGQSAPEGIAVDESFVYFSLGDGNQVMKVAKTGGSPSVVAAGAANPGDLAVDSVNVYWVAYAGEALAVPKQGGTVVKLAEGLEYPFAIAVDEANVYFTTQGRGSCRGTVMRVGTTGGGAQALATSQKEPLSIAVDATTVYWTSSIDRSIMSAPK